MQEMRKMEVGDLSAKTLNYVSRSLDKPTLNSWEDLMQSQTFCSIYSNDDAEKLRLKSSHVHPAEALIFDLANRKIPLEDLMSGLREIGNKEALFRSLNIGRNGRKVSCSHRSSSHGLKHICGNVWFNFGF